MATVSREGVMPAAGGLFGGDGFQGGVMPATGGLLGGDGSQRVGIMPATGWLIEWRRFPGGE